MRPHLELLDLDLVLDPMVVPLVLAVGEIVRAFVRILVRRSKMVVPLPFQN
jgi:hypothetical protein